MVRPKKYIYIDVDTRILAIQAKMEEDPISEEQDFHCKRKATLIVAYTFNSSSSLLKKYMLRKQNGKMIQ